DALVLHGVSLLATQKSESAIASLTSYLKLTPRGNQAEQALATRAVAEARLGNWKNADADLKQLAADFPQSELRLPKTHQVAEIAYEARNYAEAADWFGSLAKRGPESPLHAAGLSGLGWSRFQQKQ